MKKKLHLLEKIIFLSTLGIFGICNLSFAIANDCNCDGNLLANGSFESNISSSNWRETVGTSFSKDEAYNMCGTYNGLITGIGSVYQEVNVLPGNTVNFKIYGGTHNTSKNHEIRIHFYNSSDSKIASSENKEVQMDFNVGNKYVLKLFEVSAIAPAGTVKVRIEMYSSGDYFKMDGACLTVVTAPNCQECVNNVIKTNPGFETGNTTGWQTSGGSLAANTTYAVCGNYGAVFTGAGKFWRNVEVSALAGNTVHFTIYGAYHNYKNQKFSLIFLDVSNNPIGAPISVNINKVYDSEPKGLKKYELSGVAPTNAASIRIEGSSEGDYIKVDAACLILTPPALPVTLTSFEARAESNIVQLNWATTSEVNSDYFEIQRSSDGKLWSSMNKINAKTESSVLVRYSYADPQPLHGINHYRLKMVDLDNTFGFSRIVSIEVNEGHDLSLYPNPISNILMIRGRSNILNLVIFNNSGVAVYTTSKIQNNELNVSQIPAGSYLVKITTQTGEVAVKRISIQR